MEVVVVKKNRLLETLKENKATHEEDFELAWKGFKEKAIHNFEERLKQLKSLKKGQEINLFVNLDMPQNHADDYQRAIEMLDWEVGDEVELQQREFQQYVQDQWGWTGAVTLSNQMYTGSASPAKLRKAGIREPHIPDLATSSKKKSGSKKDKK